MKNFVLFLPVIVLASLTIAEEEFFDVSPAIDETGKFVDSTAMRCLGLVCILNFPSSILCRSVVTKQFWLISHCVFWFCLQYAKQHYLKWSQPSKQLIQRKHLTSVATVWMHPAMLSRHSYNYQNPKPI